jgi:hypothetical protein
MLNSNSKVSPPQRSKPRAPSRQKKWPIKVAETFVHQAAGFRRRPDAADDWQSLTD